MTKSKFTHAEKDELILDMHKAMSQMQDTMTELDKQYAEHVSKNLEFVNMNAEHVEFQHKLIENLNAQVVVFRAVNWLLTAVVGTLLGVGSYLFFWG